MLTCRSEILGGRRRRHAPQRGAIGLPAVTAPPGPAEWQAMKQQAAVITKIGLAPKSVNTPDKGLVVAMKGREPRVGAARRATLPP